MSDVDPDKLYEEAKAEDAAIEEQGITLRGLMADAAAAPEGSPESKKKFKQLYDAIDLVNKRREKWRAKYGHVFPLQPPTGYMRGNIDTPKKLVEWLKFRKKALEINRISAWGNDNWDKVHQSSTDNVIAACNAVDAVGDAVGVHRSIEDVVPEGPISFAAEYRWYDKLLLVAKACEQTNNNHGGDLPPPAATSLAPQQPEPNWADLEKTLGATLMAYSDIAEKCNVNADALRQRLTRWRGQNKDQVGSGWTENTDRGQNDPHHFYRFKTVLSVVRDLWTSSHVSNGRPAGNKNGKKSPENLAI